MNFLEDVKNGLEDITNEKNFLIKKKQFFSNIHIFNIYGNSILTLYEKDIGNNTIYMGGLNALNFGIGFYFFKEIVEIRGKEKNIEIYVIDEIGGKNHDNEWLLEKYQELGFELQKDNNGDNIKVSWGENDRNTNLVMVRLKG